MDPDEYRTILQEALEHWPARRARREAAGWPHDRVTVLALDAARSPVSEITAWLAEREVPHLIEPLARTLFLEIPDENRALELVLAFAGRAGE
jgi:hypothetical protein